MKPGPRPKPSAVQRRNGAYAQHPGRENKAEPKPQKCHPEKTPAVVADPILSSIWDRIADEMDAMKILTRCDGPLLELAAINYKEMREVGEMIKKEGWTVTGRHGHPVRHPMVPTYANLKDSWRRLIAEMGFTPSSRVGLNARVDDGEPDPFLDFLEMTKKRRDEPQENCNSARKAMANKGIHIGGKP